MTRLILFAGILVLSFAVTIAAAEKDLVAYWNFDEGTGQVVKDITGTKHDGKFVGTPKWVDGKFGKALEFDGKTSYIEVPDATDLAIETNLTFAAWFKPSVTINPTNNAYRLMTKNNDYFMLFNFAPGLGNLGWLVKDPTGTNHVVHSTTAEWKAGTWYHAAGTFDGKELKIYINGNLEATDAYVGKIGISKLALWIGADDMPIYFPGAIDEVRIYKSTLSAEEVKQMMNAPAGAAALQPSSESTTTTWGKIKEGI